MRNFEAIEKWPFRLNWFATAFRYQYCLSEEKEDIYSFTHIQVGSWNLHTGKDLPICKVTDNAGREIGVLIGIAVGREKQCNSTQVSLPFDSHHADFWDQFESYIVDVAGRYAFLLYCSGQTRLYQDPAGTIGTVYNKEDRFVAASLNLALKREIIPHPLYDFETVEKYGGKISLFHTADAYVRRLNPNFYLDLNHFQEHRFWPKHQTFSPPSALETRKNYDEISQRLAFNIAKISGRFPCALPVSAGQDSRLIIACAKGSIDKLQQIYTHVDNYATTVDADVAGDLCRALNAKHEIHRINGQTPTPREQRKIKKTFELCFGVNAPPPKQYLNGLYNSLHDNAVILRGHHTDILRAVFVFKRKKHWHDPAWQIQRLRIAPGKLHNKDIEERFAPDFKKWQDTLPDGAKRKAADFMFLEIYYNASIGALFPALWGNFYMSPFSSRRLIELALSFRDHERRVSQPVFDLIELNCPELSPIPFDFEFTDGGKNEPITLTPQQRVSARVATTKQRLRNLTEKKTHGHP